MGGVTGTPALLTHHTDRTSGDPGSRLPRGWDNSPTEKIKRSSNFYIKLIKTMKKKLSVASNSSMGLNRTTQTSPSVQQLAKN